ncbi:MAG TPA: bifunctional adenosylcobinamide kinase/adenosylcobinamide-phosphate guanylyltransferase [Nitrospira sp.]|nr:bifunctional adenosylcobinamide kinase/adenosylcobinamide-phosphate guanylyltransferase [Nitrospira sp.]
MLQARARKGTTRAKVPAQIILVLGGAASGKSDVALKLAGETTPKAFVATGQGLDTEMALRIARHRATRSVDWDTAEVPLELAAWFSSHGDRYRAIVLDCVTLWLSNLIGSHVTELGIAKRVTVLLKAMRTTSARVVIVSNELGLGLVPAEPPARAFRDAAGRVNQQIAAAADEVHLVVSGLSLRLK